MPSKKKKYNARFPAGRIKKIMQSDEEVGKVAQAVPIIISKTLELFVESLLEKTLRITNSRNAKTLSPSHMKQCIMAESRFDFLRELVKNIPDISVAEEIGHESSPGPPANNTNQGPYDLSMPSTSGATIQTPPPTNGRTSFGNGIQMHTATPPIQRSASVPTATRLSDRKRLQNSTNEINNISANFYKENSVIQHTSDMKEASSSPAKMMRMDSTQHTSHSSSIISARRLQHQSKSIPCTSKESHQPPITPAPIINIDICNRPIVKIDYSNLALHDKEPIECTAITEDKSIMSPSCISPVINIDLSKITPQPSSSLQNAVKDKTTNASTLELDEDYDNI